MSNELNPELIYRVQPRINEGEAAKKLALRSPLVWFRKIRFEKVELSYLPHYLFSVRVGWKERVEKEETVPVIADAVLGHFAFWKPAGLELMEAEGPEFELGFRLSREQTEAKLREQYRWVLISSGMKRAKEYRLLELRPGPRIYYPFWIGYWRPRGKWALELIDAVTATRQGGKVRDAFIAAFVNSNPPPT